MEGSQTILPLHLQAMWNFDSLKVGLVLLAGLVPEVVCKCTFLLLGDLSRLTMYLSASPLIGHLADKIGAEWTSVLCLLLDIPWWIILGLKLPLPAFVVTYGSEGMHNPLTHHS